MSITIQDILRDYTQIKVQAFEDTENELAPNQAMFCYWPGKASSSLLVRSDVDPISYAFLLLAALNRLGELRANWVEGCIPRDELISVSDPELT